MGRDVKWNGRLFPIHFFFLRNSCYVIFRFNKFPRATSWLSGLGHFNQHFSLNRRISFFFLPLRCPESDRRSGSYLPAHRLATPPFPWPKSVHTALCYVLFDFAFCLHCSWFLSFSMYSVFSSCFSRFQLLRWSCGSVFNQNIM